MCEAAERLGGPAAYGAYGVTKRFAIIDQHVSLAGLRVLDLGCGNGSYTTELKRRAKWVCGLDVQLSNLENFHEPLPRLQAVGEYLPFASGSLGAITMIEVLEHTEDDHRVFSECFRALVPGGKLIVFVPNRLYPLESHPCHIWNHSLGPNIPFVSWMPKRIRRRVCFARIYTRRELLAMAGEVGFHTEATGYMLPPLDNFPLPFKNFYRRYAPIIERSAFGIFGVSIFALFSKT